MSGEVIAVSIKPEDKSSAGHDQKMADLFDQTTAAPQPEPIGGVQPDASGQVEPETKVDDKGEQPKTEAPKLPENPETEEAKKALTDKGLDFDKYAQRFAEKGELDATDYDELAKAGLPKSMVDAYVEGQKAIAARTRADVLSDIGGESEFSKLLDWAKDGLSDEEKDAYNKSITGKSLPEQKLAVKNLFARYKSEATFEPSLRHGTTAVVSNGDVYESRAQVTADMRKPEYKKDAAFRAKVQAKISRSNVL